MAPAPSIARRRRARKRRPCTKARSECLRASGSGRAQRRARRGRGTTTVSTLRGGNPGLRGGIDLLMIQTRCQGRLSERLPPQYSRFSDVQLGSVVPVNVGRRSAHFIGADSSAHALLFGELAPGRSSAIISFPWQLIPVILKPFAQYLRRYMVFVNIFTSRIQTHRYIFSRARFLYFSLSLPSSAVEVGRSQ